MYMKKSIGYSITRVVHNYNIDHDIPVVCQSITIFIVMVTIVCLSLIFLSIARRLM